MDRGRSVNFLLRPCRQEDFAWVVASKGAGYRQQYGWDSSFEDLVGRIVEEFVANFDAKLEGCWIAEKDGHRIGHVFLVKHPGEPRTAKLRLLFVDASARGMGVGDALVQECVRFARVAGYRKVVLWTQSILTGAHRIYTKAGFTLVKETPHHSFGHDLVGQDWELNLR